MKPMTPEEKQADIEDKQRMYDEAKQRATEASERATKAEKLAVVEREHAMKMADRANAALRALRAATD